MKTKKLELVIERGSDNSFWGRVHYNGNLYTDNAGSIDELEISMKNVLSDFEDLKSDIIEFERRYDVYSLFEDFDFINITKFAKHIDFNAGLLRQYASGVKHPSDKQLQKILEGFHSIASKMEKVELVIG